MRVELQIKRRRSNVIVNNTEAGDFPAKWLCPILAIVSCLVHITSPALWQCKSRSVNYLNAHTDLPCSSLYVTARLCPLSACSFQEQNKCADDTNWD